MTPEQVTDEVNKAKLRGLGGAGFPTARKWTFIPKQSPKPKYLVVNADEGEPGTFKDRYILERDPHALLEGMIISAYAIGSHKAYVYIRGEYFRPAKRFQRAIDEAYRRNWLGKNIQGTGFDLDVVIHRGAGAYICGEETALLTSLEGGKGFPRIKPPFRTFRCYRFGQPGRDAALQRVRACGPPGALRGTGRRDPARPHPACWRSAQRKKTQGSRSRWPFGKDFESR